VSDSSTHQQPEFLVIGRIIGTFGWAGEIKVRPETDFPERFLDLAEIWIEKADGQRQLCHIEHVRTNPRQVRMKLVEYDSKEAAAPLLNYLVLIPAKDAMPLPEGKYYLHQIIGLTVCTIDGRNLGQITEVVRSPANDVYITPLASIPALKEVVREINLADGIMIVDGTRLAEE
jgi:16S rRNA processing protein RimM